MPITVHVDIIEVGDITKFRPYVSGIPTKNEELVANQLIVHIVRLMGTPVESPASEEAPEPPKPKRRRR